MAREKEIKSVSMNHSRLIIYLIYLLFFLITGAMTVICLWPTPLCFFAKDIVYWQRALVGFIFGIADSTLIWSFIKYVKNKNT